jgi:hypothetical protein
MKLCQVGISNSTCCYDLNSGCENEKRTCAGSLSTLRKETLPTFILSDPSHFTYHMWYYVTFYVPQAEKNGKRNNIFENARDHTK